MWWCYMVQYNFSSEVEDLIRNLLQRDPGSEINLNSITMMTLEWQFLITIPNAIKNVIAFSPHSTYTTEKRLFFQNDHPESPSLDRDSVSSNHGSFSISNANSASKNLSLFRPRDSKSSKNSSERASVAGWSLLLIHFAKLTCTDWLYVQFSRSGAGKGLNLKHHQFYCDTDWNAVFRREVMPPFVPPHSADMTDTRNFDKVSVHFERACSITHTIFERSILS